MEITVVSDTVLCIDQDTTTDPMTHVLSLSLFLNY